MRFVALRRTDFLAGLTVVPMVGLLPALQFLEANTYFKFRYGFDEEMLALIAVIFAGLPLLLWFAVSLRAPRSPKVRKLMLGLPLLLFASQLYSTSLHGRPALLQLGIPALFLGVVGVAIHKWPRELIWSLALASSLVVPYTGFQLVRHWWRIPKPPSPQQAAPAAPRHEALSGAQRSAPLEAPDIYIFLLDGCDLTSAYLDAENYPDGSFFPNLHRFVRDDAQWFYNAVSNGASTSASLPSILTGKLYSSRRNNYLANEENIFTILKPRYELRGYLHTRTCFCIHDDFQRCYPFTTREYGEPMRVLVESYAHISTFGLSPVSYAIGKLDEASYHREAFVGDFLQRVARDDGSPRFFMIQLFDRGRDGLQDFDRLLGQFLPELEKHGRYENSIVVILSDHGFNYEGTEMSYGEKARQTRRLFRVPFAIKLPGRGQGRIFDYPAQGIDVAPTLLSPVLEPRELERLQFDGVDVLAERPSREHYINRLVPDVLYRFNDDIRPDPDLVAVPLRDIKSRGRRSEVEAKQDDANGGFVQRTGAGR